MATHTALITGASKGIGLELARCHAKAGGNLVLLARSVDRLEKIKQELESEYKISVFLIQQDLSDPNAAEKVFAETEKQNISIDTLINNAGFGDFGPFIQTDWNKYAQMIQLNITTLTQLCHLYIPQMKKQRFGKILNVASTAAFLPGPLMAVYFATKAYVLSFSEALKNEVEEFGISVTALCPGPTESSFQEAADMQDSALVKNKKLPSAKVVAEYGYASMLKNKPTAVHGLKNKFLIFGIRFLPRTLVVKTVRYLQAKK